MSTPVANNVSSYPEYAFHPAAEIFPLMEQADLEALAADIAEHGLREAIVLHADGQILDGRNRYLACRIAGVTPRFRTWESDESPTTYVISLNLHRRHLTASQRSMIALKIKPLLAEEARRRQATSGPGKYGGNPLSPRGEKRFKTSDAAAGAAVGVGGMSVYRAGQVVKHGVPELAAAVERGEITVKAAAVIANLPADQQIAEMEERQHEHQRGVRIGAAKPTRHYGDAREEKQQAPAGIKRLPRQHHAAIFRRAVQALNGICLGLTELNTKEVLEASDALQLRDSLGKAISTLRGVYRAMGGNGESH